MEMLLIRGHLSSFLKVGQSKHSWHFHWAWATPMKWFFPDKKSNLIKFSPLISGIVEAISGWSSSMIKIQNRSRCDDVVVAINLFFSKRIEKLTTEWDSLGRPSPICPTHPPGGTQQLKTPEWCWLAIKSNKKSILMVIVYLSQLYSAIVPSLALSWEGLKVTVLCAGAPGKPQPDPEAAKKRF